VRSLHGVVVATVAPNASDAAGLIPGDVIHGINGADVRSLSDLRSAVEQVGADSVAVLQVGRGGRLRYLTMNLE